MKYQLYPIHLSDMQAKKLKSGNPIVVSSENLKKDTHKLLFTTRQIGKIETSKKKNKGLRLVFDAQQIKANDSVKSGGSLWDQFVSGLKKGFEETKRVLKPVAQKVKPYVRPALHTLVDVGATIAPIVKPDIAPLVPVGKKIADKTIDFVGDQVGFGMHKKHSGKGLFPPQGGGLFAPGNYTRGGRMILNPVLPPKMKRIALKM